MKRLLSIREIRELFNGTDLEFVTLTQRGRPRHANYRVQIRHVESGAPDVWGDYQTLAELNACGVFHWALERAGDLIPENDERQKMIRRILAQG